ncbi:MAG: nickel pincer cofactor biosynthesis protein LarC [Desulfobacterales bacterium]
MEVGAADAIIDVTGAVIGLNALGIEQIVCSPLHLGCGTLECAHGILPVPPPAVAELVRGLPVYSRGIEGELLTPTAAAILTSLASAFGPVPSMRIQHIGYGAGSADPAIPNFLRVMIGDTEESGNEEDDQVAVMECNMDDMNPQIYDYLMQKILQMGARDVFLTPVQMKKNRPGTMLTVISLPEQVGLFADFLLKESSSIGLRWRMEKRIRAQRRMETLETAFGTVRIKIAERGGHIVHVSPEYEDCRKLAAEKNIPLKTVMGAAASQAMHRYR